MGLSVDYPANYENVLSKSSLNEDLQIDTYAATGKIDYSEPSVDVYSTDRDGGYWGKSLNRAGNYSSNATETHITLQESSPATIIKLIKKFKK